MFLHDWADLCIAPAKILSNTTYANTTAIVFIHAMCWWFYSRLYVFPRMIYTACFQIDLNLQSPYIMLMFGMLLMFMFILHCYWFVLFCKIVASFFKTGNAEDHQSKIESK
jgi:hypothetical protein